MTAAATLIFWVATFFGSTEIKKIVMHVFPLIFRTSVREAFSQFYNVNNAVNITDVKTNYLIIFTNCSSNFFVIIRPDDNTVLRLTIIDLTSIYSIVDRLRLRHRQCCVASRGAVGLENEFVALLLQVVGRCVSPVPDNVPRQ